MQAAQSVTIHSLWLALTLSLYRHVLK